VLPTCIDSAHKMLRHLVGRSAVLRSQLAKSTASRYLATETSTSSAPPAATDADKPSVTAAARNLPPVGFTKYSHEDPIWWNFTWDYKGQKQHVFYREFASDAHWAPGQRRAVVFFSGFFWFWLFYNTYWNYEMITREYAYTDLTEYTDAELGIPPDDAEDPEYWGQHAKFQGVMQHR
jgi:hypothetical protein